MDCQKELATLVYDLVQKKWVRAPLTYENTATDMIESLTFLTYNVWHEESTFEERSTEIFRILKQSSSDCICLQEVTKPFFSKLLDSQWVQEEYYIPDISIENHTTLILSKLPCKFYMRKWPTRMERFLLYGEVEINGVLTAIATVHLESLANSRYRKKQLDITFQELYRYPKAFILGNFNFDWATENKNIPSHYVDVWPYLNSGSHGCTKAKTHDFIAWRPDRILIKKNEKYKPLLIERVGMEPLPRFSNSSSQQAISRKKSDEVQIITPSDHYGLRFVVEFLDHIKETWKFGVGRNKEKNYRETKEDRFVWIDGTKRGEEFSFYLGELEKVAATQKASLGAFDKVDDAIEDTLSKLQECDNLTLIVSVPALHEILHGMKKELKIIQDKFVHEKSFRFKIIVLTRRSNYKNANELCKNAGFEKYFVFTKFSDLVESLLIEQ